MGSLLKTWRNDLATVLLPDEQPIALSAAAYFTSAEFIAAESNNDASQPEYDELYYMLLGIPAPQTESGAKQPEPYRKPSRLSMLNPALRRRRRHSRANWQESLDAARDLTWTQTRPQDSVARRDISLLGFPGSIATSLRPMLSGDDRFLLLTNRRLLVVSLRPGRTKCTWQVGLDQLSFIQARPKFMQSGRILLGFADHSAIVVIAGMLTPGEAKNLVRGWHYLSRDS